jgi:hypothetical protein
MIAWTERETFACLIGLVLVLAIVRGSGFTLRAGSVAAELRSINKAVNSRPKGAPSISDDISRIAEQMDDVVNRLATVEHLSEKTAARVGALEHPEETP